MKIAIFHNFMDNIGGAELVDLILARELRADIYTTNIDEQKISKLGFGTKNIYSISRIPINAPFRQEAAYWKFRRLKLGKRYDRYIIGGDWAMSAAVHNHPNIWYVYSPTREIWDLYPYIRAHTVPPTMRWFYDGWVAYRRWLNRHDSKSADQLIAISQTVEQRIKKYLHREAAVIYPPTETKKYRYEKNGDFWLSVNRLITYKRIDLQLKAFAKMPNEKLIIVGSYEDSKHFTAYAQYCKKIKPANVEIVSWIDDVQLIELYAGCKAFITTSLEEDFGMTPVEAMAAGKPVIAPNEGGYRETVVNGVTGRLIDDITVEKIVSAITEIGQDPATYKDACQARAKQFDTQIFIQKFKATLGL